MNRIRRVVFVLSIVLVSVLCVSAFATAAERKFPAKPIRIIVPYAAGGGTDVVARRLASELERILRVNVIVSNVVGGSGAIGRMEAGKAAPDGYTLFMDDKAFISSYYMGVNTISWRDMQPVCRLDGAAFTLVVAANSPFHKVGDFMDYAKKNPGVITVAVSGIGGISHLNAEAIKAAGKVKLTVVSFEGGAMTRTAVLGGHATATIAQVGEIYSFVKAGDFKVLAVSDDQRSTAFPNVPTFREAGVDFSLAQWRGIYAPKGTPEAVVEKLEEAFRKAMQSQGFKELCAQSFTTPMYLDHQKFAAELEKTDAVLKEVVTEAGLMKK